MNPSLSGAVAAGLERPLASISCVIPCYNEAQNIEALLARLLPVLRGLAIAWEVLFIDDGSRDETPLQLLRASSQHPGVRALLLSRNFGKEAALSAGIEGANGDVVVLMDADLQHDPDFIPQMLAHWRAGADVVYTRRMNRNDEPPFKRVATSIFYKLLNAAHRRVRVPADAGDFRLMDRRVIQALRTLPERNRFMKGMYAWVGFRTAEIPYSPAPRAAGRSSFNLGRLAQLSIAGLTAFSNWPLRASSIVGFVLALMSFTYAAGLILQYLFWGNEVSGWTTIVVVMLFLAGVQLVSLGIVGEYVARVYEEVKGRPLYVVREHLGVGLPDDQARGTASRRAPV
jgi:glycosyltransferase involved in cell wall biosynthesis